MRRLLSLLKNELVTGLLLLAPVVGTGYLVYWLITSVDGLFPPAWRPTVAGRPVPGLGLAAVLAFAFIVGLFAHNFVGRKVIQIADGVVQKVPLFGGTYGLIKQVLEAVFSTGGGSFKRAVLVEYPLRGSWAIGFVTQSVSSEAITNAAGGEVISVFVPTCPNPTSGFYLLVGIEHVRALDMPVEQAFKLVLTMGIADADPSALATTGKWDRKTIKQSSAPETRP